MLICRRWHGHAHKLISAWRTSGPEVELYEVDLYVFPLPLSSLLSASDPMSVDSCEVSENIAGETYGMSGLGPILDNEPLEMRIS